MIRGDTRAENVQTDQATDVGVCCELCSQVFMSRNQLFKHLRKRGCNNEHVASEPETELKRLTCVVREAGIFRVVIKPQGLPTMGGRDLHGTCAQNHNDLVLEDELRCGKTTLIRALPAHRLDSGTGGLLLFSESVEAERSIKFSFASRLIDKRYHRDLKEDEGEIVTSISGQTAKTTFRVLSRHASKTYVNLTIVSLVPHTGRRHQLRRHMQSIGHPILGDSRYSHTTESNLYLWAVSLSFPHPSQNIEMLRKFATDGVGIQRVFVSLPQPEQFNRIIEREGFR